MSDGLPPVPPPDFGDGYDWMAKLGHGWQPVPGWGRDGWDLGDWPYAVVAHFDGDGLHGLAIYVEGNVDVQSFPSRAERDAVTNPVAICPKSVWELLPGGPEAADDELGEVWEHVGTFAANNPFTHNFRHERHPLYRGASVCADIADSDAGPRLIGLLVDGCERDLASETGQELEW